MANLFELLASEPAALVAGDTVRWRREDLASDYPPATHTLAYSFVGPTGVPVTVAAASDFTLTLPGATTAAWAAGSWRWSAAVTLTATGARATVAQGQLAVSAALAASTAGADVRSHAERMLAAIEAALEGRASDAAAELTLADGRAIKWLSFDELIKARAFYRGEVARAARAQSGRPSGQLLKVRMG